jgi:hypothetical protein
MFVGTGRDLSLQTESNKPSGKSVNPLNPGSNRRVQTQATDSVNSKDDILSKMGLLRLAEATLAMTENCKP